ncbi:glycosyltransferase family 2 protein [Streptomyces sp. NPDC058067]|uniref:glycosyltransferase family 2 protein n=1 Tax=Streptomyces sp. NPDC058067 TaxID=3346324 RepID=UPI0036E6F3FC
MAPEVTLTVIVHNDAHRLPRAVASLRRQTLRNVEIIISDDHSTDNTPQVAQELAAQDPRIRFLRLPENSGGCGAPRNAAIEVARAPYLMFLDSDDELPEDAARTLLDALRGSGADFAMGGVERVRTDTGRVTRWHPHLFGEARTVQGIGESPEFLFDHLSTNKMYTKEFIDRCDLRFPVGIHYEDQLFSAQAYCLARSFAVVPEPVYRWFISPYEAEDALSISNQRHRIENVRDRVGVARLIDTFLTEHGQEGLRPDKDYKFLKHDVRMYAGDLPQRDPDWIKQFADEICPYLDTLAPAAYARLPRDQRVVLGLLRSGRLDEARLAARSLGRAVAPREVTRDAAGRTFWGDSVPAEPDLVSELDVSDLELTTRRFSRALLRHEITRIEPGPDGVLDLSVRTWDPGLQLPVGPVAATLRLAAGRGLSTSFRLDAVRPGLYEGAVRLNLAAVRMPPHGFAGTRHPALTLTHRGERNSGPLFAPLDFPRQRGPVAGHLVTVEPEGRGAGRLQTVWERQGTAARVEPLLVPLRRTAGPRLKRARKLWRGLTKN